MNDKRIRYYDSVRFIAVFIVFTTHFIHTFASEYGNILWHQFPGVLVLGGVSGKFGVACLAVISGYFAWNSKRDFLNALIHRYIFFFASVLIADTLYEAYHFYYMGEAVNVASVLKSAFFLDTSILQMLWFVKPFFLSYAIICLNRLANINWGGYWRRLCYC